MALLSFDATIRSNLSVEAPIDLWRYRVDSLTTAHFASLEKHDAYWSDLRRRYSDGLSALVEGLPPPPEQLS